VTLSISIALLAFVVGRRFAARNRNDEVVPDAEEAFATAEAN
jgi:hypothetical protein